MMLSCFRFFLVILISTINLQSYAQLNLDVKVSDSHLRKVEKGKDARAKLKQYKKFYAKDSIKAAKKAWKAYRKTYKDSLQQIGKWKDLKAHKNEFIWGKWDFPELKQYTIDTTLFEPPEDSLEWAVQELAKRGSFEKIQELYESYGQYDSAYLEQFMKIDTPQFNEEQLADKFNAKERLSSYLPDELKQESDFNIAEQMKYGELDKFGNLQKVDRSGVQDFFKNVDPEEFAQSQVSLQAAKKKYTVLPDLSREEEGIKRNSLKGTPVKKRLFLTGGLAIQSTDPIVLDGNIQLGYQWTKKFATGVGLLYREQLNGRDSVSSLTGDAHGWSFFANYDIAKGFFGYGELQQVINQPIFGETSLIKTKEYAYLLGLGREFRIGKVKMMSLILYDFNYEQNSINGRPWVFRLGWQIGG